MLTIASFSLAIAMEPSAVHEERKSQLRVIEEAENVLWRAVPHPRFASLTPSPSPGFAHRWLELAEAEPWPADDRNAEKVRLRLVEKNADSRERLARTGCRGASGASR